MYNMIYQHQKPFVSFPQNTTLEKFIENTLNKLRDEIEITAKAFYQETEHDKGVIGFDKMFGGIERTWVGVFNNAVIRNNSTVASLQEFKVYSDEKEEGRCDFVFQVNNNEVFNVYTEAKQAIYQSGENITAQNNYNATFEQLGRYYEAEKRYYKCPNYLMVIRFEFVQDKNSIEKIKKAFENWQLNQDGETNFLSLYFHKERGVFVYGKVISENDFKPNKLIEQI